MIASSARRLWLQWSAALVLCVLADVTVYAPGAFAARAPSEAAVAQA